MTNHENPPRTIALLGDSVFDNAAYVGGAPDVAEQLRGIVDPGDRVLLAAVDGSRIEGVTRQLSRLSETPTHLVVSTGGNDALDHLGLFEHQVETVGEALLRVAHAISPFEALYRRMLSEVTGRGMPTAVCTIYYPCFPEPSIQALAVAALAHFNDAILREAFRAGVPVLDLRLICDDASDYANPIEPSERGGNKIANAIARLLREHDFAVRRTAIFT